MIVAEFHEEIRMTILGIVECLKDEWVRSAAIKGLSRLAAHRMCYRLSPIDLLNHGCS